MFQTSDIEILSPKLKLNTVFYRIPAPAQTQKYPDGLLYSGVHVIISKSEQAALGIPELLVLLLMSAN